jgi:hypothetical protein
MREEVAFKLWLTVFFIPQMRIVSDKSPAVCKRTFNYTHVVHFKESLYAMCFIAEIDEILA